MTKELESTMNQLGALIIEARQKADLNQSKEAAALLTEAIEQCLPAIERHVYGTSDAVAEALDAAEQFIGSLKIGDPAPFFPSMVALNKIGAARTALAATP